MPHAMLKPDGRPKQYTSSTNRRASLSRRSLPRGDGDFYTVLSSYKNSMSRGLSLLPLTNSASPGGRSFLVLLVSMLWMLMHTLCALCTGLQPCEPSRSRHIIPFEEMCGWIGIGRSLCFSNVTSGGSKWAASCQSPCVHRVRAGDGVVVSTGSFSPMGYDLGNRNRKR